MKIEDKFLHKKNQLRLYSYHTIKDTECDNFDLFVEYEGKTYSGQIYTVKSVQNLLEKSDYPGYFVDFNGIVINSIDKKNLRRAISGLIDEGEFHTVFCKQE